MYILQVHALIYVIILNSEVLSYSWGISFLIERSILEAFDRKIDIASGSEG